jgi:hypothetical protein
MFLSVPLFGTWVGAAVGSVLGIWSARLLTAFVIGAFLGAVIPPAMVLGLWAATRNPPTPADAGAWSPYGQLALTLGSPLLSLATGGLCAYIAAHLKRDESQ